MNQTERKGHQTKNVVVRGGSSCIFCSARDESKGEIWADIKSMFLISSPNYTLNIFIVIRIEL